MVNTRRPFSNGSITTQEVVAEMKEKILLTLTAGVVVLILCWGVTAIASSHNTMQPTVVNLDSEEITVDVSYDLSGIKLIPERAERLDRIPNARRAKLNR